MRSERVQTTRRTGGCSAAFNAEFTTTSGAPSVTRYFDLADDGKSDYNQRNGSIIPFREEQYCLLIIACCAIKSLCTRDYFLFCAMYGATPNTLPHELLITN